VRSLLPLAVAAVIAGSAGACSLDADVSRELGARCDRKAECDEQCLVPSEQFPGGFCTLSCVNDADCPGRAACATVEGGVCLFRCLEDVHCEFLGEDWFCRQDPQNSEVRICLGPP
jgi:hypothetical protein